MGGRGLILSLCAAEVLTMAGVFAFPALLPGFVVEWGLSKTEAGWIAGLYFAAYAVTAPPVLALTDRIDARLVYGAGTLLTAVAAAGFAWFADGFWSALAFRTLAGSALAATYLPGLRVLIDRYRGPRPSRALSLYTSSFSLGTALSFLVAGEIAASLDWRAVFWASAGAGLLAGIVPLALPPVTPERPAVARPLLDLRPVFGNRPALGYVLAYGVHCWELFALRSWMVAFLAAALALQPHAGGPSPTTVATIAGLVAMAASIGGNELCLRWGRRRVIVGVMIASATVAAGIGFAVAIPYPLLVGLCLLYSALVQLDSASLTAGAVETAAPGQRGATLAMHAMIGFGCAGIGPLVLGLTLDATGGGVGPWSWGPGFAGVAAAVLLGPTALLLTRPGRDDRRRDPDRDPSPDTRGD